MSNAIRMKTVNSLKEKSKNVTTTYHSIKDMVLRSERRKNLHLDQTAGNRTDPDDLTETIRSEVLQYAARSAPTCNRKELMRRS